MKLKKWENPNLTSLNLSETNADTYHHPTAWHCSNPICPTNLPGYPGYPGTTATEGIDGNFRCDKCGTILGKNDWVGDGPHPS